MYCGVRKIGAWKAISRGSPGLGTMLYIGSTQGRKIQSSLIPTCESLGQISSANSAWVDCGVAGGLPLGAGGRLMLMSRGSWQGHSGRGCCWKRLVVKKARVRSGCPPAWEVEG